MSTYASTSCPLNPTAYNSSRSNRNLCTYMKCAFVARAMVSRASLSLVSMVKNFDTFSTDLFLKCLGTLTFVNSPLMFNTGNVPISLLKRDMYSTHCTAVSLELKHIYLTL